MIDLILALDDSTALNIASTIATVQARRCDCVTSCDSALASALGTVLLPELLGDSSSIGALGPVDSVAPPSGGDLARAALLVLSEQPEYRPGIQALISGPVAESFGAVEVLSASAIGLLVLQTHFKFERDKSGRYTFKLEKKPTQIELLKKLLDALIGCLGRS